MGGARRERIWVAIPPRDMKRLIKPSPVPTMSSPTNKKQKMSAVAPCQTMRGHTDWVRGVVHLPRRQHIITCEDWRDERAGVYNMALSPNGKTVVSGNGDGKVRLWDVETGKVVAKWTGHTESVSSVCWSAGGKRVLSGSEDGTARVWDVKTGETILEIKTGHEHMFAVIYSPDNTQMATAGYNENAVKIWDAKTGGLIATLKHDSIVESLAWTSDREKLISGSYGPIRIFDTTTWQQIVILEGHEGFVNTITLSQNNRLLASVSRDETVRLWDLDTNLPVGLPLHYKYKLQSAAFSVDGKVLATGCRDKNVYVWDIHDILKKAGLEDLLPTGTELAPKDTLEQKTSQGEPGIERTPRSSLSDKSFLEADATQCHDEFGCDDVFSPRFFDGMEADDHDSSPTGDAHPHSSASALLVRLASLLHRFRPNNHDANEIPQPSTLSGLHPRVLFARLSSLIHCSPPENDASNELQ
ncbi:WD40 repeat-like protein [Suillus weaverae]|nr:WD40 repeat-like protein [Suillus weaverae]